MSDLANIWEVLGLDLASLNDLLEVGDFGISAKDRDGTIFWPKLATLMAGRLGNVIHSLSMVEIKFSIFIFYSINIEGKYFRLKTVLVKSSFY